MVECDHCGTDASEVWRHREFGETATHRSTVWICRDCHPELPVRASAEAASESDVAMTDGGTGTPSCPRCGGSTVNGQGLFSCDGCRWSGPR